MNYISLVKNIMSKVKSWSLRTIPMLAMLNGAGLIGCSRIDGDHSLKVKIIVPKNVMAKSVTTQSIEANQKWCFGIEVWATDIPRQGKNSCRPDVGPRAGFAEENQEFSLTVSKGNQRHFQLYSLLVNQTETCPDFDEAFFLNPLQLKSLYVLDEQIVDLQNDIEPLNFNFVEPNLANDLATTLKLADDCFTTITPISSPTITPVTTPISSPTITPVITPISSPVSVAINSPNNTEFVTNNNMSAFTVSGTCSEPERTVTVTTTGGIFATPKCNSGFWSTSLNLISLADGVVTITASHDNANGVTATPASVIVTKDSIAPTITTFSITNSSPANSTTYNLILTASELPTEYCILENSITFTSCNWQNAPLPTVFIVNATNNDKTLSVWVKDAAGNTSPRVDSNIVHLDTATAAIAITAPVASTYINTTSNISSYTIAGTCNKEGGSVIVKVGSTSLVTTACSSNTWTSTVNLSNISDGNFSLTAELIDLNSTSTISTPISLTKDMVTPTVSAFSIINASPSNTVIYDLTFTATDTPSYYCVLENSTVIGNCSWTSTPLPTFFTVSSTQNAKVLSAWVKDLAGNISARTDSNSVTLNSTVPTAPTSLTLYSPASSPGSINTPAIQITGVNIGDTVYLYSDSSCSLSFLKGSATVSTGNAVTITSSALSDNNYIFYAKTINAASTASSCSTANVSYTLDTVAPTSPSISINGNAPYTVNVSVPLTLSAADANEMYITNTAGCNTGGTYESYAASKNDWTLATSNSDNSVYVKFRDLAGNETACVSDNIIHDNIGPDAPTTLSLGSVPSSDINTPILSWNTSTDNAGGSGIASYQVQVFRASDNSFVTGCPAWTTLTSGTNLTCNTASFVNSTPYYMRVRAIDSAGNIGAGSTPSPNWTATTAINCPTGYIKVPALTGYTATDFCVAKYEMKNITGVATSQPASSPWTNISRGTDPAITGSAWKACTDLGQGFDLISNAQWQTIARDIADNAANWSNGTSYTGELNRGHSDSVPAGALAATADDTNGNCINTGESCNSTIWNSQRRTHILSNGNVIWDFAGNVAEWVKDNNATPQGTPGFSSSFNTGDSRQTNYGNDTFCSGAGISPYCGMGYGATNYSTGAITRGGFMSESVNYAGIFAANLSMSPSSPNTNIGFRCVFSPP